MNPFTKIVRIGTKSGYPGGRAYSVFCKIAYSEGRLSISGVEGPLPSGNCLGSCGQINMHLKPDQIGKYAKGWDAQTLQQFLDAWDQWHLNDMRPYCEHQRNWNLDEQIVTHSFRPTSEYYRMSCKAKSGGLSSDDYDKFAAVATVVEHLCYSHDKPQYITDQAQAMIVNGWVEDTTKAESARWVRFSQHPYGLLCKPCEVCGYKYGSSWLSEEVSSDVLDFLRNLPDADREPAWV